MRKPIILCSILFVLCSFAPNISAEQLFKNSGFESFGDANTPTDWLVLGIVQSVDSWNSIEPHSGERMAVLAPFMFGNAQLAQQVDFTGYSGMATLSFWWRYDTYRTADSTGKTDWFEVLAAFPNDYPGESIWDAQIEVSPGQRVTTDWMHVGISGDISELSEFVFAFSLHNLNETLADTNQSTAIFLDDVTLTAVPEPASLLLVGAGLGLIGLVRWRRR